MLIEAPYKAGDTITMKTTAGDEVVARLVEEKTDSIVVMKPMMIMVGPQGIGLGPYTFTINPEAKVTFNKSLLVVLAKTDGEMAKQYISSTTGIQIA